MDENKAYKVYVDSMDELSESEVLDVEDLDNVTGGAARKRVRVVTTVVDSNGKKKQVVVYMYADQLSARDKKIYGIT